MVNNKLKRLYERKLREIEGEDGGVLEEIYKDMRGLIGKVDGGIEGMENTATISAENVSDKMHKLAEENSEFESLAEEFDGYTETLRTDLLNEFKSEVYEKFIKPMNELEDKVSKLINEEKREGDLNGENLKEKTSRPGNELAREIMEYNPELTVKDAQKIIEYINNYK
ncbi:MAG: hypothetical protein ACOCRX_09570 [Candidatus Woesearchaeota archaeon]